MIDLPERDIDVSDWPEQGQKLVDRVIAEVKKENYIHSLPPNTIILSKAQYESLEDSDTLWFMNDYNEILDIVKASKERLFYTPDFVMEVRIKGENYDTGNKETPEGDIILKG